MKVTIFCYNYSQFVYFLYLEDIFVRLYFHIQFEVHLVPQFVQIDVNTMPSNLYNTVEYFETNSCYGSFFAKRRSLPVANARTNPIHVR